ncbi:MAG: hypothetical protein U1E25_02120 [Methylocystis sp.]
MRARLPAAAGAVALAEGLVRWEGEGGERRLTLTDAGRAHLRRLSAPDVDQAEPFRAQHASYALRQLDKARVGARQQIESPLAWLARRGIATGGLPRRRAAREPASAFAATSNRRSCCSG